MENWLSILHFINKYLIVPLFSGIIFLGILLISVKQEDKFIQLKIISRFFLGYGILYTTYLLISALFFWDNTPDLDFI